MNIHTKYIRPPKQATHSAFVLEQFFACPVLVPRRESDQASNLSTPENSLPSIGQISPHNQRDLFLVKFLDRNLERIRFTLKIHKHRSIHARNPLLVNLQPHTESSTNEPNLQGPCAQNTRSLVLGHVRGGRALLGGNLLLPDLFHDLS